MTQNLVYFTQCPLHTCKACNPAVIGPSVPSTPTRSSLFIMMFKSLPLLTYCLIILSVAGRCILKSSTMINPLFFLLALFSFCFACFRFYFKVRTRFRWLHLPVELTCGHYGTLLFISGNTSCLSVLVCLVSVWLSQLSSGWCFHDILFYTLSQTVGSCCFVFPAWQSFDFNWIIGSAYIEHIPDFFFLVLIPSYYLSYICSVRLLFPFSLLLPCLI